MRILHELTLWLLRAVLIALCTVYAWPVLSGVAGAAAAMDDVAHGKLIVRVLGLPAPWVFDEKRILAQSCGVQMSLGGCMVSPARINNARVYNAVSLAVIRRKFGRDIVQDMDAELERKWNQKQHIASD